MIVGDINTVTGFRLAGLRRTHVIEESVEEEEFKVFLEELCDDNKIGVIAVTDNLLDRVKDLTISRSSPPVVMRIPKLQRPLFPDVKEYYRKQITDILGFGIEL